MLLNNRHKNH